MSVSYYSHFQRLANYHRWAYIGLFQSLKTTENNSFVLSDEQYYANSNLFFHSIHGTLVHLYLAELLWYCRLNPNESIPHLDSDIESMEAVSSMWNQDSAEKWTQFFCKNESKNISREEMEQKILQQCDRWIEYVTNHCTVKNIDETFEYKNTKGITFFKVRGEILDHIFNHGTHHRGQITAAMTAFHGRRLSPSLDLLYFYDQNS